MFVDEKKLRREFAERLRRLIAKEKSPKKLASFAKRSGITMSKLSEWQNPQRSEWPSMHNLLKLCAAAHRDPNYFLLGEDTVAERYQSLMSTLNEGEKIRFREIVSHAAEQATKEAAEQQQRSEAKEKRNDRREVNRDD